MRLLLDTHVLLWWLADARELSSRARALVTEPENLVFVSAATLWEIRIKEALGKLRVPAELTATLGQNSFEMLSVTAAHTETLRGLPLHHRDPFDRMLLSQAATEGLTLVSHDSALGRYGIALEVV